MSSYGADLTSIVAAASGLKEIRKGDLVEGDWIFARTMNSMYRIRVLAHGMYEVSGGWFDAHGLSPALTKINGCTWGTRVIKTDIVAARGMSIEFQKRIITSAIRAVAHIPGCRSN
jgi:hypothetical protein